MLELTAAVGATVMVHHPGSVPSRPAAELDRLHALERSRLRELGDLAARLCVRVAVETLFIESDRVYRRPTPPASPPSSGPSTTRTSSARSTSATATS